MTEYFLTSLGLREDHVPVFYTGMEPFILFKALESTVCSVQALPFLKTGIKAHYVGEIENLTLPNRATLMKIMNASNKDGYMPVSFFYLSQLQLHPENREALTSSIMSELTYFLTGKLIATYVLYNNNILD